MSLCFFLVILSSYASAYDVIRYRVSKKMATEAENYPFDLLKLALEESRYLYGDYKLIPVHMKMTQERVSTMLEQNKIVDVAWRVTSNELEKRLRAIYFPLQKGLTGARIFVIKKNHQMLFTKQTTLEDLKRLPLGQGFDWPDTQILEHNGFNVTKADTPHLLAMLEKARFDYFPRAVHEPWQEIIGHAHFMVEKNLMLYYPSPNFFFVNKKNTKLFKRIHDGLKRAHVTGRFDDFFNTHPISAGILEKARVKDRKLFYLENPLLSEKTRQLYNQKSLWIELPFPSIRTQR